MGYEDIPICVRCSLFKFCGYHRNRVYDCLLGLRDISQSNVDLCQKYISFWVKTPPRTLVPMSKPF